MFFTIVRPENVEENSELLLIHRMAIELALLPNTHEVQPKTEVEVRNEAIEKFLAKIFDTKVLEAKEGQQKSKDPGIIAVSYTHLTLPTTPYV